MKCAVSRSTVSRSSSWCALTSSVPPGVSYARRDFVQFIEQIDRAELRAIHRNRRARFKSDFDFFGFVRRFVGRHDPLPHRLIRSVGGILELGAFMAQVPDVAVAAIDIFLALLDGYVVLFGIGNRVFARIDVPLAPRRDDL